MDFGDAIRLLKEGHRVARQGWNGKSMWLALVPPTSGEALPTIKPRYIAFGDEIANLTRLPWIGMRTADMAFVPWLASQTDVLAEDWVDLEVIEAPEPAPKPQPTQEQVIAKAVAHMLELANKGGRNMPEKPVDVLVAVCQHHLKAVGLPVPTGLRAICNDALMQALIKG